MNEKYGGLVSNPRNTKDTQVVKSITYTTNGTVVETVNLNAWPAATESNTPSPTPPEPSPTKDGFRVLGNALQIQSGDVFVDVAFNGKQVYAEFDVQFDGIGIYFTPSPIDASSTVYELTTNNVTAGSSAINVQLNYVQNNGLILTVGRKELNLGIDGDGSPYYII